MSTGQYSVCKGLGKSSNSHQGRNECNYQGTYTGIKHTKLYQNLHSQNELGSTSI